MFSESGLARRGLLVRHLVMPGMVEEGRQILSWLAQLDTDTFLNLMEQYRPTHKVGTHKQSPRFSHNK